MLEIQRAIKRVIERFIVNLIPLSETAAAGSTIIKPQYIRRFEEGEVIVVYSKDSPSAHPKGEVHVISDIDQDNTKITLDSPLIGNYPSSISYVEKMIGFEDGSETFLDAVYIGEPDPILRYPAITVSGESRNSDWLTLESTEEKYTLKISVYVLAADYESQYELMQAYVKAIENSLFRSFYPLVEPYDITTLADDVDADDYYIRVANPEFYRTGLGWIFLESHNDLRHNYTCEHLGSGVLRMSHKVGKDFSAGDKVIRPRRHIFNSLPRTTQYDTIKKGSMLKAATITYECTEEVKRYTPFLDPLTF